MGIRAFGAVGVEGPGGPVAVGGALERAVLALLVSRSGRVVADDVLVEELWDGQPAERALNSLRVRVSRLRRSLAAVGATIEHVAGGYRIEADNDQIDIERFRSAASHSLGSHGRDAVEHAERALYEWVDEPFAEYRYHDAFGPVRSELTALRRELVAHRTHELIDAGDGAASLELILKEVDAAPSDERLVRAAMRALADQERPNEALEVFARCSAQLAERGLEPSPLTRTFEDNVLTEVPVNRGGAPETERVAIPQWRRPIGRDGEIERILRLIGSERLVTVVGPGGVGKTRVAVAVAGETDDFDVVWWVSLSEVDDGSDIWRAIAGAVDAQRRSADEVMEWIIGRVGTRSALIVVDNCEHLAEAVRTTIGPLLDVMPGLHVLATSQSGLGIGSEAVVRLSPITVPAPASDRESALETAAVQLFIEGCRRVGVENDLDIEQVSALVRELDGLPLAIELAAAQSVLHQPGEILERVRRDPDALDLAGSRNRSVTRSVEWSIGLLDEPTRSALSRLAHIPPGFAPDLAEVLIDDDAHSGTLKRLVDHSLVQVHGVEGRSRLRILEPIRRVVEGDADADTVDRLHLDAMMRALRRSDEIEAPSAIADIKREQHQFEAAFATALRTRPDLALELAGRLGRYWSRHADWSIGLEWYEAALELELAGAEPSQVASILYDAAGLLLFAARDSHRAEATYGRLDEFARAHGLPRPFNGLSLVQSYRGDYPAAMDLLRRQIEQDATTGADPTTPLANLAHLHVETGDSDTAETLIERARAEGLRRGTHHRAHTDMVAAQIAFESGAEDVGRRLAEALLDRWIEADVNLDHQVNIHHLLAHHAIENGDWESAVAPLTRAASLLDLVDRDLPHHLLLVAAIRESNGDRDTADLLRSEALGRLGSDEMLFPSRRRLVPPGIVRVTPRPRHALLAVSREVLATVDIR